MSSRHRSPTAGPLFFTRRALAAVLALLLPCFAGCDRRPTAATPEPGRVEPDPVAKTKTLETARLDAAIAGFEKEPTERKRAEVKKGFANLDGEIAELHERIARTAGSDRDEAAAKARNLESYRTAENIRFTKAQAGAPLEEPAAQARPGTETLENGARRAGQTVEAGAKKVGEVVGDAAKKAGDAIKDATK